ncbi:uncharacterized protein A4U43_C09F10510 [Asparagus officinalis]|uniref:Uncharacterized protein n=1 Tax=Asparagus officinalis TaxID=4686 RepID=A0A5P1EBI3_ASPOF|nr:uncharacterized protein A4U43_C09F10510 [Asparagus officinalis]
MTPLLEELAAVVASSVTAVEAGFVGCRTANKSVVGWGLRRGQGGRGFEGWGGARVAGGATWWRGLSGSRRGAERGDVGGQSGHGRLATVAREPNKQTLCTASTAAHSWDLASIWPLCHASV